MRIMVMGTGGVGGYFGGKLAASWNEVTFVARGEHGDTGKNGIVSRIPVAAVTADASPLQHVAVSSIDVGRPDDRRDHVVSSAGTSSPRLR